jgi:heme oxygenase
MRRKYMEKKKTDQEATFSEEVQRYIKQNRL